MATLNIGIVVSATNRASGAINAARRDVDGLGTSLRRIAQVMRAVQALFLVNQIASWGRQLVTAVTQLQSVQLRLAAVTGSMQKANQIFAELNQKYGPAGLDVQVLAQGFTRLAASGLSLDKTRETIDALANATAAFGGTGQELQRAVIGISQVVGKGTLQMEELRQQIGESVPVAMRIMADAAGVSVARFTDNVTKGLYSSEQAVQFFIDGSRKAFGNYVDLLGSTLAGSLGRIKAEFLGGLQNILANTNFDEGLVAIFNSIADAVKNFMASIDQTTVDKFFSTIQKLTDVFIGLAPAVYAVVNGLLQVADTMLTVLAALPPDVISGLGIIGLFLFGGTFGRILAIVGVVFGLMERFGVTVNDLSSSFKAALPIGLIGMAFLGPIGGAIFTILVTAFDKLLTYFRKEIAYFLSWFDEEQAKAWERAVDKSQSVIGALMDVATQAGKTKDAMGSIFSYTSKDTSGRSGDVTYYGQEALKRIMADQAKLAGATNIPKAIEDGFKQGADAAGRLADRLARLRKDISDTITQITDKLDILAKELGNDQLGLALAQIKKQYDDMSIKITDQIQKAEQLNKKTGDQAGNIEKLKALLTQVNQLREIANQKAETLYQIELRQSLIQERMQQLRLDQQIMDAKRAADTSVLGNIFADTEGGRALLDLTRQQLDLKIQIAELEDQIAARQTDYINAEESKKDAIQGTIDKLKELKDVQEKTLNSLSLSAQMSGQLWRDVGSSISNNVGTALNDLAHGTFNVNKLMLALWESITNAVIKYIQKIIEAQIQAFILKSITGGIGGMGAGAGGSFLDAGTPVGGPIALAANGAIARGGVKMFANGDIIRGPTMFGIAGEAGDEAIMPLTRIGGKLGVRAEGGGGGDNYNITIQAIDTQTGIEFVRKHIEHIQGGLQQRSFLNRGMKVTP